MAFNADTYRINKHRKQAWKALADARALRDRIRKGDAYDWEVEIMMPRHVRNARAEMHTSLFWRRMRALKESTRK